MCVLQYSNWSKLYGFYIHTTRLDIINVEACGCDSLYRTIYSGLYAMMKLSAVLFIYLLSHMFCCRYAQLRELSATSREKCLSRRYTQKISKYVSHCTIELCL